MPYISGDIFSLQLAVLLILYCMLELESRKVKVSVFKPYICRGLKYLCLFFLFYLYNAKYSKAIAYPKSKCKCQLFMRGFKPTEAIMGLARFID